MPRQPDEDCDVILYECRSRWTVWLGGDKQGERESLEAAIRLARAVAAVHRKSAWVLDETGFPLKLSAPNSDLPQVRAFSVST